MVGVGWKGGSLFATLDVSNVEMRMSAFQETALFGMDARHLAIWYSNCQRKWLVAVPN